MNIEVKKLPVVEVPFVEVSMRLTQVEAIHLQQLCIANMDVPGMLAQRNKAITAVTLTNLMGKIHAALYEHLK